MNPGFDTFTDAEAPSEDGGGAGKNFVNPISDDSLILAHFLFPLRGNDT